MKAKCITNCEVQTEDGSRKQFVKGTVYEIDDYTLEAAKRCFEEPEKAPPTTKQTRKKGD